MNEDQPSAACELTLLAEIAQRHQRLAGINRFQWHTAGLLGFQDELAQRLIDTGKTAACCLDQLVTPRRRPSLVQQRGDLSDDAVIIGYRLRAEHAALTITQQQTSQGGAGPRSQPPGIEIDQPISANCASAIATRQLQPLAP